MQRMCEGVLIPSLFSAGLFDEMPVDVDEAEHSLELHAPYIRHVFKGQSESPSTQSTSCVLDVLPRLIAPGPLSCRHHAGSHNGGVAHARDRGEIRGGTGALSAGP